MRGKSDLVPVTVRGIILASTPKAHQFYNGSVTVWVPRSQIIGMGEDDAGNVVSIFIPKWLADTKNLRRRNMYA